MNEGLNGGGLPPMAPRPRNNNSVVITIIIVAAAILITVLVLFFLRNDGQTEVVREIIVEKEASAEEKSTAQGATVAAASPSPEARKQSLLNDYEKILRQNPSESYFMTDLNSNGFPELWITYNVGKNADGMIHVYHGEKGHAREIYSLSADGIATKGKYVITEQGDGYLSLYTYDGSRVKEVYEDIDRLLDDSSIYWRNANNLTTTHNTGPLRDSFKR